MVSVTMAFAVLALCQAAFARSPDYRRELAPWQLQKLDEFDGQQNQQQDGGMMRRMEGEGGVERDSDRQDGGVFSLLSSLRGDREEGSSRRRGSYPPYNLLDDTLFRAFRPYRGQNNRREDQEGQGMRQDQAEGRDSAFPRGLFKDAFRSVVPYSRGYAQKFYGAKLYRLPSRFPVEIPEARSFEDSVQEYFSTRREYFFDLVSEVLRVCGGRFAEGKVRNLEQWWEGDFDNYVVPPAYGYYNKGQYFKDAIRKVMSGQVEGPKSLDEFRAMFLIGFADNICPAAMSFVVDVQRYLEYKNKPAYAYKPYGYKPSYYKYFSNY